LSSASKSDMPGINASTRSAWISGLPILKVDRVSKPESAGQ
jgi:hypothetical protein